ncbi:hypothetical protein TRIUR3_16467 [Triticum urartu]|uniref:Uncharacterized protein n=1 Tax=Triticum urartu TaxID=4572 RepID=M8AHN7_TRIUA|nr:hypothetical protein TRIUR3_16467 [Triticum urartu]
MAAGGGWTWWGVGGEARGNEGVPLGDLFRWSGRWLEEEEEAGAPAIREAEESSGWPHSEASERLSRSSAGNQKIGGSSKVGRRRVPAQRHHALRHPLSCQQPAALHRGPVPRPRVAQEAHEWTTRRPRDGEGGKNGVAGWYRWIVVRQGNFV